ncbi:MAG: putative bifunctional diguanylate cyclase/phosphodiesterase [Myxococcales bacterium]
MKPHESRLRLDLQPAYGKTAPSGLSNMHPRLRRQLDRHLGAGAEPPGRIRELLLEVEGEYARADRDGASLRRVLDLLSDLLRRNDELSSLEPPARRPGPMARALRRLFAQAPFAGIFCDSDLRVVAWNPAAHRLLGWSQEETKGRDVTTFVAAEPDREALRAALASPDTARSVRAVTTRDGRILPCDWHVAPLRNRKGEPAGVALLIEEAPQDRFAAAVEAAGDAAFEWDMGAGQLWVSDRFRDLIGGEAPDGKPSAWLDRVHPDDRETLQSALDAHLAGQFPRLENEHRVRQPDGSWRWVLVRGLTHRDGQGRALRTCGIFADVTAQRQQQERMLHDAFHDPLTRLPNRALFADLVKRSFARARRREGYRFAVLFLDLDRFKAVNDGLGHQVGDELLIQMCQRLQTCLREGDTLARHGGDELTILLDDIKTPNDAVVVADRIHQVTGEAFQVNAHSAFCTVSIGIALSSSAYGKPEELLRDADTAMYRAKAQGRARSVVFDPTMREREPELMRLESDLRRALLREEFRVEYLPIVDVETGRIEGIEALLRWVHPERGVIPPDDFVPFAEETGLIVPIGRWLLRTASRDFQNLRHAGRLDGITLNINLSSKQLLQTDLLDQFEEVLRETHLSPQDLVLEITETAFQHSEQAAQRLGELKSRGFRLYMDDFGTGYSSLNSLYRFQLDSLKIDRSLFRGGSPKGQAPELVKTIVAFAKDLGKEVVAEGVETAEQLRFVREIGCASAQGYFFSPPVDRLELRSLLESQPSWKETTQQTH